MLHSMRNPKNQSLVWILLVLLIVGLIGFGINNTGSTTRSIGQVGETDITIQQYTDNVRAATRTFTQILRRQPQAEELAQLGLLAGALDRSVNQATLIEEARLTGISVSDETLRNRLLNDPNFQGLDGNFNQSDYELFLRERRLDIKDYQETQRNQEASVILERSLFEGGFVPKTLFETLTNYNLETRDVTVFRLTEDDLDALPDTPNDADIRAYYDENPDEFQSLEVRKITYASLSPDMIDIAPISEEDLRADYDAQKDAFYQPARRVLDRLVFSSTEEAAKARARLQENEVSFEELVAERDLTLADVSLGIVESDALQEEAARTLFAEDVALGVHGPLPSDLGPALFNIRNILPEENPTFDDVKEDLREDLTQFEQQNQIIERIEQIEDLLASGATLEELASETEMVLGDIDFTSASNEGIAETLEFQNSASLVTQDDFPELIEASDGSIFALRLNETIPSGLRDFDDAKEDAQKAVIALNIDEALRVKAEALRVQLQTGIAEKTGEAFSNVSRNDFSSGVPAPVLERLFEGEKDDFMNLSHGEERILARIDAITGPDANNEETAQILETVNAQLEATLSSELARHFAQSASDELGVIIRNDIVNQVLSQTFPGYQPLN